jgi:hypothetical protein
MIGTYDLSQLAFLGCFTFYYLLSKGAADMENNLLFKSHPLHFAQGYVVFGEQRIIHHFSSFNDPS